MRNAMAYFSVGVLAFVFVVGIVTDEPLDALFALAVGVHYLREFVEDK